MEEPSTDRRYVALACKDLLLDLRTGWCNGAPIGGVRTHRVRSPAVPIETGVPPQLRNGLPLAAAAGGRSPQADIVPHHRSLCSGNAEIHPGDVAIEVRAVSKYQALQQKGRSHQPQLDRYRSGAKRRSGTSHHGVRFGTAPTDRKSGV